MPWPKRFSAPVAWSADMPFTIVRGDLFESGLSAIGHGCNCAGAMGAGIALEFRKRYPRMYQEYRHRCQKGQFTPGDVFPWTEGGITIFNLGTQDDWHHGATLGHIERSIYAMIQLAAEMNIPCIGLPRIGAGLGGLPWFQVRVTLERLGESTPIELRVFEI